ncbi:hypothetical protein LZD49_16625 [Dyadobacter sp. CY261]|uniref:MAG6450 family protein n=1 Tax=Dyadobacter sp. CY261 TaxID=2907203 RepID=UPI001F1FB726|nr:hypothetical protein [Dyadobacter sp. CY261]MCF0072107.1 hypothetical protein [Dyadobacter sp. CY261]
MKDKRKERTIPDSAANKKNNIDGILLTIDEGKIFGVAANRNEHPYVNLKYFDSAHECLSEWEKDELKLLSDFINKITNSNWGDIQKSCTKHKDRNALPISKKIDQISPDITFLELRVSIKARVHGFRSANAFFLCWLDRNHQIYPM